MVGDFELLKDVVTFVAGGGLVGLLGFIKWYLKRLDDRKKDRIPILLERIHEVYFILNTLLADTRYKRIVLLRAENGGDIPALGKDIYSSIIYEAFDHPLESIKSNWLQQKLDEPYLHVLMRVAQGGEYVVETDQMRPGVLKDFYEATGVKKARFYKVHSRPGAFFYLACQATSNFDLSAAQRNSLRVHLNRLSALFTQDLNEIR